MNVNWDAAGVGLAAFMALTSLVAWLWQIRGMAVENREDIAALIPRLERAEKTANSVERLADAVKYSADLTAEQIKNLSERFGEHASFTKEQLADIRQEQKAVRTALSAHDGARGRSN